MTLTGDFDDNLKYFKMSFSYYSLATLNEILYGNKQTFCLNSSKIQPKNITLSSNISTAPTVAADTSALLSAYWFTDLTDTTVMFHGRGSGAYVNYTTDGVSGTLGANRVRVTYLAPYSRNLSSGLNTASSYGQTVYGTPMSATNQGCTILPTGELASAGAYVTGGLFYICISIVNLKTGVAVRTITDIQPEVTRDFTTYSDTDGADIVECLGYGDDEKTTLLLNYKYTTPISDFDHRDKQKIYKVVIATGESTLLLYLNASHGDINYSVISVGGSNRYLMYSISYPSYLKFYLFDTSDNSSTLMKSITASPAAISITSYKIRATIDKEVGGNVIYWGYHNRNSYYSSKYYYRVYAGYCKYIIDTATNTVLLSNNINTTGGSSFIQSFFYAPYVNWRPFLALDSFKQGDIVDTWVTSDSALQGNIVVYCIVKKRECVD